MSNAKALFGFTVIAMVVTLAVIALPSNPMGLY